jgi:hypothetical protein
MSVKYGLGNASYSDEGITLKFSCLNGNPKNTFSTLVSSKATFNNGKPIPEGGKVLAIISKDGKVDESKICPWMDGTTPDLLIGGIGKGVVLDVNEDPYEGLSRVSGDSATAAAADVLPKTMGLQVSHINGEEMILPTVIAFAGENDDQYFVGSNVYFFITGNAAGDSVASNLVVSEGDCF